MRERIRIPKESETIGKLREKRIREKVEAQRKRFHFPPAWWTGAVEETSIVLLLFALNLALLSPFLTTPDRGTIFSAPVIPLLARIFEFLGISFEQSLRAVLTIFMALFPVTFYLFVRSLTGRKLPAFAATLFVSFPISPFLGERVRAAFVNGDGPHIASLTFGPLALLGLLSFLRHGGLRNLVIASVGIALVGLTSPFGFMIAILSSVIAAFSEMLLGRGRLKFVRAVLAILVSLGLTSFWYNPGFVRLILVSPQGQDVFETFSKLIPISFFAVPILGVFGFLLFERRPQLQPLFLASFLTIIFFLIVAVGGGIFPSHPTRYTSEFGAALAFLLGILVWWLVDFIKLDKRAQKLIGVDGKKREILANLIPVGLFLLFLLLSLARFSYFRELSQPPVLGLWEGVQRGEIWQIRERADGIASILGYIITGITFGGIGLISTRIRQLPRTAH